MRTHMYYAFKTALTLAVVLVVLQMFVPEVAARLVDLTTRVIDVMILALDQATVALPS